MKHFYVARHGQTDWNIVPKVQGATDIPLNETGLQQARDLAEKIKNSNLKIDVILHSPLIRAIQTAKIISETNNIPMISESQLVEQNFGKFEGWENTSPESKKIFREAKMQMTNSHGGGESMFRLAQRIYNLLDKLKNNGDDRTYLLICHGGVVRMIESYFNEMTNEQFADFSVDNCCMLEYNFN